MTVKTFSPFFKAMGTVSLKVLRALWKVVCVLATGCGYILVQGGKHSSAANEEPSDSAKIQQPIDEYDDWALSNKLY